LLKLELRSSRLSAARRGGMLPSFAQTKDAHVELVPPLRRLAFLGVGPAVARLAARCTAAAVKSALAKKKISLALQGGGSHGAFTWGVLDRLLEDERIALQGVSGASAGAINAALLASGLTEGGPEGARRKLGQFWQSIMTSLPNPAMQALLMLTRFLAPAQLNPLNLNPLREILAAQIDFERLRRECRLALFVAATEVGSGMPRIFRTSEITAEVLLASACLPSVHHAVEIEGKAYWDGGLTANPPLRPLIYECEARDLLLVRLGAG
jgi:NTE family protein